MNDGIAKNINNMENQLRVEEKLDLQKFREGHTDFSNNFRPDMEALDESFHSLDAELLTVHRIVEGHHQDYYALRKEVNILLESRTEVSQEVHLCFTWTSESFDRLEKNVIQPEETVQNDDPIGQKRESWRK